MQAICTTQPLTIVVALGFIMLFLFFLGLVVGGTQRRYDSHE